MELDAPSETGRISEDEGTEPSISEVADVGSETEVDKGSEGAEEDAAVLMAASEVLAEISREEVIASPRLEVTEGISTLLNDEAAKDVVAAPPTAESNETTSPEATAGEA